MDSISLQAALVVSAFNEERTYFLPSYEASVDEIDQLIQTLYSTKDPKQRREIAIVLGNIEDSVNVPEITFRNLALEFPDLPFTSNAVDYRSSSCHSFIGHISSW